MPAVATLPRSARLSVSSWRLIRDEPRSGARNMALDHALAEHSADGVGVLRLYGWREPTVSFGRNEPARGIYSRQEAHARGIEYVRRPTGGRAVLHDGELTYSVVAPRAGVGSVRATYREINEAIAGALRQMAVPARIASVRSALRPHAGPCFQAPAGGEVVAAGRKLVGSAQARIGRAILQHGSILVREDQSSLGELCGGPPSPGTSVTLRELIGDVNIDEVVDAVAMTLRRALGGRWASGDFSREELETADRLESERYCKGAWTWRR